MTELKKVANKKLEELADLYRDYELEKRRALKELSKIRTEIEKFMGDNVILVSREGDELFTWNWTNPIKSFDREQFDIDMPGVYEKYMKLGDPQRRFSFKALLEV